MTQKPFFISLIILLTITSCTTVKSDEKLIENMLILEDQIQRMNEIQVDRGTSFLRKLQAEFHTTPSYDEIKRSKLKYLLDKMNEIEQETTFIISLIEQYKLDLLKKSGENIQEGRDKNASSILWRKYDKVNTGNMPSRLNLSALKDKSNSEIVTNYFIQSDNLTPTDKGMKLWNALNSYRSNLVQSLGSYTLGDHSFQFNPVSINTYSDNQDLQEKVQRMVEISKANLREDSRVLIDLYVHLTKPEKIQYKDVDLHWISATFKDSPLINAMASLSSLQQDILSARAMALAHWASNFSSCGYGFTSIIPVATGPSVAHEGEEVSIKVIMAAFDSYNQPEVTVSETNSSITVADGTGLVTVKPKAGINKYKGTITIKNKSGVAKTENWEWTVNVLPR